MDAHFEFVLRLADDQLVLGHRISEWCGHAPMLEEDLALPNIALDLIGQARMLYTHAGVIEGKGRNEDQLAYLRPEQEYLNLLIVERENGDFAHTMLRLFYYASFMELFWEKMLTSSDEVLAGIAAKAIKEVRYHVRHSAEWVIRMGDGTDESARRLEDAYEDLEAYCAEMFEMDDVARDMVAAGAGVDTEALKEAWKAKVEAVFREAMLNRFAPVDGHRRGGRKGRHGEEMGFLLADLQYMQRTYPGLNW
jgi:ring-1,2-phenylacetyl-CoA epoxidase subunit PaaC